MKRLFKWLSGLVLGISILGTIAVFLLPTVLDVQPVIVLSGSMVPVLPVGGLALMEAVDPEMVQVGEIITFIAPSDPDILITHRVIEIIREPSLTFQTKGDAVEDPDPFTVPAEDVRGMVRFAIPQAGYIIEDASEYVKGRKRFGLILGVPSVLLIIGEIRTMMFLMGPDSRKARWRQKRAKRLKKRWPRAARRLA